ncbi:MAG: response regulator transcription factor [Clostridium sp.]|uniref:response regulator transcription factor n=1 Tax=Clostridium sp. TaxID=1506 RepID=UPI00304599F0
MKILIVEDEKDLLDSLTEGLKLAGYAVDSCADGNKAYEMAFCENYDLIVLDLNLPKLDGIEVLKNIRSENKIVNIIILTARNNIEDKVKGLDLGANDYLAKPFYFAELEARIRSLLRRRTIQEDIILRCKGINIDISSRKVHINGEDIILTSKETSILQYMIINKGRIISLEELLEHVWDNTVDLFSNSVRVHMSSLRRKLKGKLGFDPIKNIIGEGYIISD